MKKCILFCLFSIVFFTVAANAGQAEKNLKLRVGLETYHHTYKEPNIMENKGYFAGLVYSAMYDKGILLGVEGLLSYGQIDYRSTSTGESDNIDDICSDTRVIVGYSFTNESEIIVTPFAGAAYRFLQDDSENELTSTSNIGYLRESNYFYSPIGIKIDIPLSGAWHLKPEFEYDLFWFGKQNSYLGYLAGYEDISNDQSDGYGYQVSLALSKKDRKIGYHLEIFYRYWDIEQSDVTMDSYGRNWIEPDNETSEIGVNISILF